jgi:hypothetical protein
LTRLILAVSAAALVASAIPLRLGAQTPSSNLGLTAVAGIGIHAGGARLERSSDGLEAGGVLDLGWWRGRNVRLQAEMSILRATLSEYLELEDSTFVGAYYDLSVGVSGIWLTNADSRFSPYLLAGVAAHALSSTFGILELDGRYNTNRFGSHVGAGVRVRPGAGDTGIYVEGRRVIANEVDRTVIRAGVMMFFGDLAHHIR